MLRAIVLPMCAVCLSVAWTCTTDAAEPTGTVSATGTVTVEVAPSGFRLQQTLAARAKTAEEALERLKTRRETALGKLEELGAEKDAIKVQKPRLQQGTICLPEATPPMSAVPPTLTPGVTPSGPAMTTPPTTAPAMPPPLPATSLPATGPAAPRVPVRPVLEATPAAETAPPMLTPPIAPPAAAAASPGWTPGPSVRSSPSESEEAVLPRPSGSPGARLLRHIAGNEAPTAPSVVAYAAPAAAPGYAAAPSYGMPVRQETCYTATQTITVDWQPKADGDAAWLAETDKLKEKIQAADLSGTRDTAKLPPEETNMGMPSPYVPCTPYPAAPPAPISYSSTPTAYPCCPAPAFGASTFPGAVAFDLSPKFSYVAKLSADARQAAQKEAFAQAQADAEELATAAGMKLGPVATLSGPMSLMPATPPGCATHGAEAEFATYARACVTIRVQASFHLK